MRGGVWTERIAAEEFAYHEAEVNLLSSTGNITHLSAIGAMNERGEFAAKRTSGRRVRSNDGDEQASLSDLDLLDQHPFGKGQEERFFHVTLTDQATSNSRGFGGKYTIFFSAPLI